MNQSVRQITQKLLDFALKSNIGRKFPKIPSVDYIYAGAILGHVMTSKYVQEINFGDSTVNAIYPSHVLSMHSMITCSHEELLDVTRANKWLLIMFPIEGDATLEDSSVTLPESRAQPLANQTIHIS